MENKVEKRLRKEIREIILREYHGPNFMEPLLGKLEDLDRELDKVHKNIVQNEFLKTTVDRDFRYIEKFLGKTIKYAKLATKALDKVTS